MATKDRAAKATDGASRGPGRPRDARHDQAILDATLGILLEQGYRGVTIEGVATRAGVGRPTIYRRWPSKPAVVVAALVQSDRLALPAPDTGSLRNDLIAVQRHQVERMNSPDARRVTAGLIADLADDPELADTYVSQFLAPRRATVWEVLSRCRPRRARRRRRLRLHLRPAGRAALHASRRMGTAASARRRRKNRRRDPGRIRPNPQALTHLTANRKPQGRPGSRWTNRRGDGYGPGSPSLQCWSRRPRCAPHPHTTTPPGHHLAAP